MKAIARILEALLMMVDPENGRRLVDSQKPRKTPRQPMSDERFEQIEDLVIMVMAGAIPFAMVALLIVAMLLTGK